MRSKLFRSRLPFVTSFVLISVITISLAAFALAQQQGAPPQGAPAGGVAARGGPLPPATEPRPPQNDNYANRHKGFVEIAQKGDIGLLWVGDSITDLWKNRAQDIYEKYFGAFKPANFGISGDITQGVLWRMQNGELDGYKAKLIILMLGTNNLRGNDNDDIARGDAAIIDEFKKHQPQAKVLLLGIFPRGASADDPLRTRIKDVNSKLAKLADNKQVFYMDIGDKFLAPDGTITAEIMNDFLHPTGKGYQIWADATIDKIKELMK
jgi:lysophospholipase L1-like esterase